MLDGDGLREDKKGKTLEIKLQLWLVMIMQKI